MSQSLLRMVFSFLLFIEGLSAAFGAEQNCKPFQLQSYKSRYKSSAECWQKEKKYKGATEYCCGIAFGDAVPDPTTVRDVSGSSLPPDPVDPPEVCEREARIGVDWVFSDAGARGTFSRFRRDGYSPADAVIASQGHNPQAQAQLRRCRGWIQTYVLTKPIGNFTSPTLTARAVSKEDCTCISVTPSDRSYEVSSNCDNMRVTVSFVDALNSQIKAALPAGIVGLGRPKLIGRPGMGVPSISAYSLQSARNTISCPMN